VVCNVELWYEIKCHGINVQSSWDDMVRHYGAVCNVMLWYQIKCYAVTDCAEMAV